MKRYKITARLLLTIHAIWVLAMFASLPLILKYQWAYIPAIFVAGATLISWIIYGSCPLRTWENNLYAKYAPEKMYTDLFTQHYINKLFNVRIPTSVIRAVNGGMMVAVIIISFK